MSGGRGKLFPYTCAQCTYDECAATSVRERRVKGQLKRARQVHHRLGQKRWWHWSDQTVVDPATQLS